MARIGGRLGGLGTVSMLAGPGALSRVRPEATWIGTLFDLRGTGQV